MRQGRWRWRADTQREWRLLNAKAGEGGDERSHQLGHGDGTSSTVGYLLVGRLRPAAT